MKKKHSWCIYNNLANISRLVSSSSAPLQFMNREIRLILCYFIFTVTLHSFRSVPCHSIPFIHSLTLEFLLSSAIQNSAKWFCSCCCSFNCHASLCEYYVRLYRCNAVGSVRDGASCVSSVNRKLNQPVCSTIYFGWCGRNIYNSIIIFYFVTYSFVCARRYHQ